MGLLETIIVYSIFLFIVGAVVSCLGLWIFLKFFRILGLSKLLGLIISEIYAIVKYNIDFILKEDEEE